VPTIYASLQDVSGKPVHALNVDDS